jgi:3'-5' exoribonuclease
VTDYLTIKQLQALDQSSELAFSGIYFIKRKLTKTTKNGNPYLLLEFSDASGSFVTNIFNNSNAYVTFEDISEGSLIKIQGTTRFYNNQISPDIYSVALFSLEEATELGIAQQLIEVPPESESYLWDELTQGIEQIKYPALNATVKYVIQNHESAFRGASAAIAMHHAYRHGLLEHTVHMMQIGLSLLPIYKEVDFDLAIAGIILHDIGKLEEYEGEIVTKTTRVGVLQGHVVLGYKIVRKAAIISKLSEDLTERLEHIVISHQGEKEWGAAAMAATPEAVFVSMIDNLDAKMGMVQRTLRNAPENAEFSDYLPGLKTKLLLTPPNKEK